MKWVDEIEAALIQLGGASKYSELYDRIEQTTERKLTPKWKASVRQCVEAHSPDSLSFQKNNNKEIIRDANPNNV